MRLLPLRQGRGEPPREGRGEVICIIGNASLLDLRPAVLGDLAALEDEPGARPRRGQASDALADGWRVVELAVAPAFARARGVMPRVARPLGPLGVAGAPPRVGLAPLVTCDASLCVEPDLGGTQEKID